MRSRARNSQAGAAEGESPCAFSSLLRCKGRKSLCRNQFADLLPCPLTRATRPTIECARKVICPILFNANRFHRLQTFSQEFSSFQFEGSPNCPSPSGFLSSPQTNCEGSVKARPGIATRKKEVMRAPPLVSSMSVGVKGNLGRRATA